MEIQNISGPDYVPRDFSSESKVQENADTTENVVKESIPEPEKGNQIDTYG